jgi:phosphoribosylanthranilate isomerase
LEPDFVQLHFKETAKQTAEIAAELKKWDIKTIKAVDSESEIEALCESDIFAILVDSRTHQNAAENVQAVDADLFNRIRAKSTKPLIIAGGMTPDNVSDIVLRTGADWIDIMTGVERSPGVKERIKIESLVRKGRMLPSFT